MASQRDKQAEEYRTRAQQAREKAETMLSEAARRTMFETAEMWEAMATALEGQKEPK